MPLFSPINSDMASFTKISYFEYSNNWTAREWDYGTVAEMHPTLNMALRINMKSDPMKRDCVICNFVMEKASSIPENLKLGTHLQHFLDLREHPITHIHANQA
jgi:hypothetical protein